MKLFVWDTITCKKYVFPIRNLHIYLWSLTYCSTVKDIQEYISRNINQNKHGKSTVGMMLLSMLRVQENNILSKWYKETTVLCFDGLEDGDLHILSQSTCSHFYLWFEAPCETLAYSQTLYIQALKFANGLPCLFCLRAPPFTLQLKLLHSCVSFWETEDYKNALQQVLCNLWFIYYLPPLSLLESTG